MEKLKLDNHRGLPMYFIQERIKGLNFKINFSDTKIASVGDELELGNFIFRIDSIKENRLSPLNYGVNIPVYFHSTTSKIVRKIELNAQKQKVEVIVKD